MRKIILCLSCLASSLFTIAQESSLLQNFKFRVAHYRALTLYANSSNQYSNSDFPLFIDKSSAYSGGLGGNYTHIKSTDRILLETSVSSHSTFYGNNHKNNGGKNSNQGISSGAQISILNKWFKRDFFTELGSDASLNYQAGKSSAANFPSYSKGSGSSESISLRLGIGKGRLENITGMQNALWLAKILAADHKLSRELSANELNGLGEMITVSANTRVLDSRIKRQFILEAIDDYFRKKELIGQPDIRYFSDLNDILFFAVNEARLSGTEKFIRLSPAIYHLSNTNRDNIQMSKYEKQLAMGSAKLSIGFNKYRPINLKRQFNYGVAVFVNHIIENYSEKNFNGGIVTARLDGNPVVKQAGINLFTDYAIYPNTRTIVSFNFNGQTGYEDFKPDHDFFGEANLSGTLSYFISYKTRLTANLGAGYYRNLKAINNYLQPVPNNFQLFANAGIEINL